MAPSSTVGSKPAASSNRPARGGSGGFAVGPGDANNKLVFVQVFTHKLLPGHDNAFLFGG